GVLRRPLLADADPHALAAPRVARHHRRDGGHDPRGGGPRVEGLRPSRSVDRRDDPGAALPGRSPHGGVLPEDPHALPHPRVVRRGGAGEGSARGAAAGQLRPGRGAQVHGPRPARVAPARAVRRVRRDGARREQQPGRFVDGHPEARGTRRGGPGGTVEGREEIAGTPGQVVPVGGVRGGPRGAAPGRIAAEVRALPCPRLHPHAAEPPGYFFRDSRYARSDASSGTVSGSTSPTGMIDVSTLPRFFTVFSGSTVATPRMLRISTSSPDSRTTKPS